MATVPHTDSPDSPETPDSPPPHLRLVHTSTTPAPKRTGTTLRSTTRTSPRDDAGTTTAEYTVVTAAAVAFGALLLKLLTGSWGERILETAFREVIKMIGV